MSPLLWIKKIFKSSFISLPQHTYMCAYTLFHLSLLSPSNTSFISILVFNILNIICLCNTCSDFCKPGQYWVTQESVRNHATPSGQEGGRNQQFPPDECRCWLQLIVLLRRYFVTNCIQIADLNRISTFCRVMYSATCIKSLQ